VFCYLGALTFFTAWHRKSPSFLVALIVNGAQAERSTAQIPEFTGNEDTNIKQFFYAKNSSSQPVHPKG